MTVNVRRTWHALLVVALAGTGCNTNEPMAEPSTAPGPVTTSESKPDTIAPPPAPGVAPSSEAKPTGTDQPAPTATIPEAEPSKAAAPAPTKESASAGKVTLDKVTFDELLKRIAADKDAKFTIVDAWATWCGPCKENFPHVVQMHEKYAGKGLKVISLSLDDPAEPKKVEEARAFLDEKKAEFTNLLLDEEQAAAFDKLNINAIPAVFLYGPDGKEIKRFTMDDPNKQFTYDEVEKVVETLLAGGKP